MRWPAKIARLLTHGPRRCNIALGHGRYPEGWPGRILPHYVMAAGLDPAIHVFVKRRKTWMPGTRPGMTNRPMPDLLPPDLSPGALAFLLATAFIAALARGFSGFGAALIFLPLAATVTDPKIASPLLLITDAVLAVGFIPPALRVADKREVGIMGLGAAIGIPLGTLILVRTDPHAHPLGHRGAGNRDARAADVRLALSGQADRAALLHGRRLRGRVLAAPRRWAGRR